MRWIKKLTPWIGIGLCVALMARKAWVYGEEWEFSPHGIPVSALSPDGSTYRNGSSIDPVSRLIIESGFEEISEAALLSILLLLALVFAFQLAAFKHALEANARSEGLAAVLAYISELERAGRHEVAQQARDEYLKLLAGDMEKRNR